MICLKFLGKIQNRRNYWNWNICSFPAHMDRRWANLRAEIAWGVLVSCVSGCGELPGEEQGWEECARLGWEHQGGIFISGCCFFFFLRTKEAPVVSDGCFSLFVCFVFFFWAKKRQLRSRDGTLQFLNCAALRSQSVTVWTVVLCHESLIWVYAFSYYQWVELVRTRREN